MRGTPDSVDKIVRASRISEEILQEPVRFLQFLVKFIRKVVYIEIKIQFFFDFFNFLKSQKIKGDYMNRNLFSKILYLNSLVDFFK